MAGKDSTVVTQACSRCKEVPPPPAELRRGRCPRCYDEWVRKKPVGAGAVCVGCGERRRDALRQLELHRMWVVVCHNCAARAAKLPSLPRSVEGLQLKLRRERRWGDRRAESVVGVTAKRRRPGATERRDGDRRTSDRNYIDMTGSVIELEADFADEDEGKDTYDGPITDVHQRVDPGDL